MGCPTTSQATPLNNHLDLAFTHPVNIPNAWTRHSRGYRLFTCQRARPCGPVCRFRDTRRLRLSPQPSFASRLRGGEIYRAFSRCQPCAKPFFRTYQDCVLPAKFAENTHRLCDRSDLSRTSQDDETPQRPLSFRSPRDTFRVCSADARVTMSF